MLNETISVIFQHRASHCWKITENEPSNQRKGDFPTLLCKTTQEFKMNPVIVELRPTKKKMSGIASKSFIDDANIH